MKQNPAIRIILLVALAMAMAANAKSQNDFRVVFYNVENLFDTHDNPQKEDNDFLPDGFMRWTQWKYWQKLRNITRVITAIGEMQSPALVGMCEVENDSVMFYLTKRSPLHAQKYEYIVTNSPDRRGINVALLYQRDQFGLTSHCEYEVDFGGDSTRTTRNILHATGRLENGSLLDVFVCHFPSRSGGQRASQHLRVSAAKTLRGKIDSLYAVRSDANIIIMGDFNDHPNNTSLNKTLNARSADEPHTDNNLYNLLRRRHTARDLGTYKYQGNWEILDQIIVNSHLLTGKNGVKVRNATAHIFKAPFILIDDEKHGGKQPFRTNLGPRYLGGFSDHLPVYIDLDIKTSF